MISATYPEHQIPSMLEQAKEASHKVAMRTFMVTNGTLFTKDKVLLLKKFADGFQITFDGSQPFHDTTRIYKNGKGTYADVLKATVMYTSASPR